MYKCTIRPLVFELSEKDPEKAHNAVIAALRYLGWQEEHVFNAVEKFCAVEDLRLEQKILGLNFRNPVGLAAGFDKNGLALRGIQSLGPGFLEMGTTTRYKQPGNDRPRIVRIPELGVAINWMGFNNDGADIVAERLFCAKPIGVPLGINLGKSKVTPLEQAVDDYLYSFKALFRFADYIVMNVSSPNTVGLRKLQDKGRLGILLEAFQKENVVLAKKFGVNPKPILVKIAPDLASQAIYELLDVCFQYNIDGIIWCNTTTNREGLPIGTEVRGGMCGELLFDRAITGAEFIKREIRDKMVLVGVGGINSAERAYFMLRFADLIEIYTALPYEGPFIWRNINRALLRFMERDGIKHISELRRW